jgi:hypothetical protein
MRGELTDFVTQIQDGQGFLYKRSSATGVSLDTLLTR